MNGVGHRRDAGLRVQRQPGENKCCWALRIAGSIPKSRAVCMEVEVGLESSGNVSSELLLPSRIQVGAWGYTPVGVRVSHRLP